MCIIIQILDNNTTIDITATSNRYCNPHLPGEAPELEEAKLGLKPGPPPGPGAL